MKMIKNSLIIFPALLLSMGLYAPALALETGLSVDASVNLTRSSDENRDADVRSTTSVNARIESERNERDEDERDYDSSSDRDSERKDAEDESATTSTSTESRSLKAEEHRSVVSTFVKNLLKIADRDGGIGAQVRVVAQEQNDSNASTTESIKKVEARNSLKTFLIGSDYKNLGKIRSDLANTDKRIERLTELASSTTNVQLRADLNAQVKLLQDDLAKVTAFVNANENRFSLFGWFSRMFAK